MRRGASRLRCCGLALIVCLIAMAGNYLVRATTPITVCLELHFRLYSYLRSKPQKRICEADGRIA